MSNDMLGPEFSITYWDDKQKACFNALTELEKEQFKVSMFAYPLQWLEAGNP